MLNEVLKVSSGTCQQFVEDAVKISNIFGFSNFTAEVEVFVCAHREFSHESDDKRILIIGAHLPKLLSNIKRYTFWDTVYTVHIYRVSKKIVHLCLCQNWVKFPRQVGWNIQHAISATLPSTYQNLLKFMKFDTKVLTETTTMQFFETCCILAKHSNSMGIF